MEGEHCSMQCCSSAMMVSFMFGVRTLHVVATCAFPTAVRKVPLMVVKTPNRYVCVFELSTLCYCTVELVVTLQFFTFVFPFALSIEQDVRQITVQCEGQTGVTIFVHVCLSIVLCAVL